MIRLISMLKRKPGLTHQEFLDHWHQNHGPLIKNGSMAKYVRRYEQHPAVWPPEGSGLPEPDFDGVTIQWFDDMDSFNAHLQEPDQAEMFEDINRFLDTDKIYWTMTDVPDVVIGD